MSVSNQNQSQDRFNSRLQGRESSQPLVMGTEEQGKEALQRMLSREFVEYRSRVLDLAAFLDRLDQMNASLKSEDYRVVSLKKAVGELVGGVGQRIHRVQNLLSDPTILIGEHPEGCHTATGAPKESCC